MKKLLIIVILFFSQIANATPVLNFSDIISGPKTGNSDGDGSGAIVTVWGNGLGSSQGASSIYIGNVETDHVYYWKDADGELPGGPSDLSTNHKMQEICFSVPATAVDGVNTIRVVVGGANSNTLPFTVRTGNIYFIKSAGNDSTGTGSWSQPWLTYNSVMSGDGKLSAGDIVYSVGVDTTTGIRIGGTASVTGTSSSPISLLAYPNTSCDISGEGGDDAVIDHWYPSSRNTEYVNISKLSVTAAGNSGRECNGIIAMPHNRIVGVEITGPTVYGGYGGAITCSGSSSNPPIGGKYLGIYIHNYGYRSTTPGLNNYSYEYTSDSGTWTSPPYDGIGDACTNCTSIDRFQHLYYLSIRQNDTIVDPYEIGWNNLVNNPILEGIHIYDMNTTGSGFNSALRVHNNWIQNQGGPALDVSLPYDAAYAKIDFYNNIITVDNTSLWSGEAIRSSGDEDIKIWNNTIYGYRLYGLTASGGNPLADYKNNIMVDTLGYGFAAFAPDSVGNNLFYSTGSTALPSWYSALNGDINSNPLFTDAATHDFSLQSGSQAISNGSALSVVEAVYADDLFGLLRTDPVDIGAIQYAEGGGTPTYDAPIVEILTESQTATAATITIIGTLVVDSALTGTGVDVNGVAATADDGTFDEASEAWTTLGVTLSLGANTITATGTDSELQIDTDIKTDWITRTAPPSVTSRGKGYNFKGCSLK